MNGKEITQADLNKIRLTDNPDVARLIDRVVARINRDAEKEEVSTNTVPA
jgi:hypothetical protein